jgi:hypothetical protein
MLTMTHKISLVPSSQSLRGTKATTLMMIQEIVNKANRAIIKFYVIHNRETKANAMAMFRQNFIDSMYLSSATIEHHSRPAVYLQLLTSLLALELKSERIVSHF